MEYGKLPHLAVTNVIDLGNLKSFDKSKFNTWKYRIDGSQLRLQFGSEVYDTFEENKVSGLLLEFYDLWGFAGSIELSDKKSYNGVFTKIINLNSLKALSTKRTIDITNSNIKSYTRNIGIVKKEGKYWYNDIETTYNTSTGWSNIDNLENDCGTLYSNLVYCVKAYFKQEDSDGNVTFTKNAEDFVLFTIPIYNDYFYTVNNFNNLKDPKLDLQLTYKINNSNNISYYTGGNITEGYNVSDKNKFNLLHTNSCHELSLTMTKYYQYSGEMQLWLEVGLKESYKNFGIQYDKDINEKVSFNVILADINSGESLSATDSVGSNYDRNLLNYKDDSLSTDINVITFKGGGIECEIPTGTLQTYNYLTSQGNPITISYRFVVGHDLIVSNIKNVHLNIPVICALYHTTDATDAHNNYIPNYEDFSIYENYTNQKTNYYSTNIINVVGGWDTTWMHMRLCKQKKDNGYLSDQLQIMESVEITKKKIDSTPSCIGKNMQKLFENKNLIGKLSFCMPQIFGVQEITEEIYGYYSNISSVGLPLNTINGVDDWPNQYYHGGSAKYRSVSRGIVPRSFLHDNPRYTSILITPRTYNGEWYDATLYREPCTGDVLSFLERTNNLQALDPFLNYTTGVDHLKYIGFTGQNLEQFNRTLLTTMKDVYAYNPDYSQLQIQKGDVSFIPNSIYFNSGIVVKNIKLSLEDSTTFSDYVYLGSYKYSDYLKQLFEYSKHSIDESLLQFQEHFQDFPDGENSGCLLRELSFNIQTPTDTLAEFMIDEASTIAVRHTDRTYDFGNCDEYNKKALYGWDSNNKKLVQLDVSNYEIDFNGNLKLLDYENSKNFCVPCVKTEDYWNWEANNFVIQDRYKKAQFRGISLTINDLIYEHGQTHRLFVDMDPTQPLKNKIKYNQAASVYITQMYKETEEKIEDRGNDIRKMENAYNRTNRDNGEQVAVYLYCGPCFKPDDFKSN